MNINNVNQTNFGANFINNVTIKRFDYKAHQYKPFKASFVQFDPKNKEDFAAMVGAVKSWKGEDYASTIVDYANRLRTNYLSPKIHRIYMVTTQQDKFDKLEKSKILGMVQMQSDSIDPDEIRYLQVKPDQKHGNKEREFRLVGSKILSSIKKIYNEKITLLASYSAANFYEKHGFTITEPDLLEYEWVNKKKP